MSKQMTSEEGSLWTAGSLSLESIDATTSTHVVGLKYVCMCAYEETEDCILGAVPFCTFIFKELY